MNFFKYVPFNNIEKHKRIKHSWAFPTTVIRYNNLNLFFIIIL